MGPYEGNLCEAVYSWILWRVMKHFRGLASELSLRNQLQHRQQYEDMSERLSQFIQLFHSYVKPPESPDSTPGSHSTPTQTFVAQ
ncbi:unnamed protein product [Oppiella nova]|uniref:Uncharacterized protein n=1 Tax=Oppiella nova TaxID=334625 RepID=A0A7R9MMI9_9ACAR|nr:unnamed protein product [Oppiella nova]CAG2178977.1 unnamed protein product [Oppiella nova]